MKINQVYELSLNDLTARSYELKVELLHLRIKRQSGQLEKPSQLRQIRREIAQLLTVHTQKTSLIKKS